MIDIPIIMYHSVNDQPSENPLGHLSVSSCEFEAQLRGLADSGFEFTTLAALQSMAELGRLEDRRWIVLTFDDGYLDNLLFAKPILEAFGASATVYVSPDFVDDGRVRSLTEVPNAWGYLNWAELRLLEDSGTFDVQSHTLTHDHVFLGDRVVDVYTSEKFGEYYWLTHLLAPETKPQWQGDVSRFATVVPDGYPIFQHGRALAGRRFLPAPDFVAECLTAFQRGGEEEVMNHATSPDRGRLENAEDCRRRLHRELADSKLLIEGRLAKPVESVCFPGGVYDDYVLQEAARAGYRTFMRSSRAVANRNLTALADVCSNSSSSCLVGLSRIGFTRDYPRRYFRRSSAYWNARLKVHSFIRPARRHSVLRLARGVRNGFRKARVH